MNPAGRNQKKSHVGATDVGGRTGPGDWLLLVVYPSLFGPSARCQESTNGSQTHGNCKLPQSAPGWERLALTIIAVDQPPCKVCVILPPSRGGGNAEREMALPRRMGREETATPAPPSFAWPGVPSAPSTQRCRSNAALVHSQKRKASIRARGIAGYHCGRVTHQMLVNSAHQRGGCRSCAFLFLGRNVDTEMDDHG